MLSILFAHYCYIYSIYSMYSVEIILSHVILPVILLLLIHRNLVLILLYEVLILLFHSTHMCFYSFH